MNNPHPDFDATDAALAARLRSVAPPPDLRRKLLALAPPPRRAAWWTLPVPAFALVALTLCALGSLALAPRQSVGAARAHFAAFFNTDFQLETTGQPLPAIRAWLKRCDVAPGATIPGGLAAYAPEGCRRITWGGHRGALICFPTGPCAIAHLIILPDAAFTDAAPRVPGPGRHDADWNSLAWSAGGYTYLVFAQTDDATLLRLLAALRAGPRPGEKV